MVTFCDTCNMRMQDDEMCCYFCPVKLMRLNVSDIFFNASFPLLSSK